MALVHPACSEHLSHPRQHYAATKHNKTLSSLPEVHNISNIVRTRPDLEEDGSDGLVEFDGKLDEEGENIFLSVHAKRLPVESSRKRNLVDRAQVLHLSEAQQNDVTRVTRKGRQGKERRADQFDKDVVRKESGAGFEARSDVCAATDLLRFVDV